MRAAQDSVFAGPVRRAYPESARRVLRQALPLAVAGLFLVLLRDRVAHVDTRAVLTAFAAVTPAQWLAALMATAVSFWAVGHYDAVLHRHLGTGIPCARARRAGIAGIAISQTLGLGIVTGALVRWRLLPGASLWLATRLTAAVAVSFLMGWAIVTAVAVLALPLPGTQGLRAVAVLVLIAAAAAMALSLFAPPLRLGRRSFAWPSLDTLLRIPLLAAIDTGAAALVLWVLMPADTAPGFALLLPAFLLALGAGLVSNAPGGIGVFELTLLALLPSMAEEPMLAAILAYRAVYYALPAVLGGIAMALGPRAREAAAERPALIPPACELTPHLARLLANAPRAEVHLLRQGEHAVLIDGAATAGWMLGRTRQALVAISDPFGARDAAPDLIRRLEAEAARAGRIPCLYKTGARIAARARRAGWQAAPVAREAWLAPALFDVAAPGCAGLRRKLRKAEKAGLAVARTGRGTGQDIPLAEMQALTREWAGARGGERGFSMGRFAPAYVAGQAIWTARHAGRLVGFVTFHQGTREWTLDLMRQSADAPDGTIHALVAAALDAARRAGLPRLSLAALPPDRSAARTPLARLLRRAEAAAGLEGLRQFKAAFSPNWETLYIAAPSRPALAIAALDIAGRIARPDPLPAAGTAGFGLNGPVARDHRAGDPGTGARPGAASQ